MDLCHSKKRTDDKTNPNLYIISCEFKNVLGYSEKISHNISSLGDAIHIQRTVWLLNSKLNSNEIVELLKEKLDSNDTLFVSELIKPNYQGWMNIEYWNWLKRL